MASSSKPKAATKRAVAKKAPTHFAPSIGVLIRRRRVGANWTYEDPAEAKAAVQLAMFTGFDLSAWDDLIDMTHAAHMEDHTRARAYMLAERARLLELWNREGQPSDHAIDLARLCHMQLQYGVLLPKAEHGEIFLNNEKKARAPTPVRAFVRAHLRTHADASTADVWEAIKTRKPKGCTVRESPTIAGWYIETPGQKDTGFDRFANIVSEERSKL